MSMGYQVIPAKRVIKSSSNTDEKNTQATQTKKTLRRTRRRINLAASSKTVSKFKISTNRRKGSLGTISVDLKSLLE